MYSEPCDKFLYAQHAKDDRQAKRKQGVETACHQPAKNLKQQESRIHRKDAGAFQPEMHPQASCYLGIVQPVSASGRVTLSAGRVAMIFVKSYGSVTSALALTCASKASWAT